VAYHSAPHLTNLIATHAGLRLRTASNVDSDLSDLETHYGAGYFLAPRAENTNIDLLYFSLQGLTQMAGEQFKEQPR
jgi:hypothetical protein